MGYMKFKQNPRDILLASTPVPVDSTKVYWCDSKLIHGLTKMAHWVKVFVANPDNLSLIPRTHVVERTDSTSCLVTSGLVLWHMHVHIH